VSSVFMVLYVFKKFFSYILIFTFWGAEPGGIVPRCG